MAKATRKYTDTGYADALNEQLTDLRDVIGEIAGAVEDSQVCGDHTGNALRNLQKALDAAVDDMGHMDDEGYEAFGDVIGLVDEGYPTGL